MIDVHMWTSLSACLVKYGGLHGCRTAIAGDARSSTMCLLEVFAMGWLMMSRCS